MVTSNYHEPVELNKAMPWSVDNNEISFYLNLNWWTVFNDTDFLTYDDQNPFHPHEGWRVILHNTDELPSSNDFHFFQVYETLTSIKVQPDLFLFDDDLKASSPESRLCYLQGEKALNLFKKYTKANCEHEHTKVTLTRVR